MVFCMRDSSRRQNNLRLIALPISTVPESEESDHDDEPVGGTILVRLQAAVGPQGVRGRRYASRAFRSYLAARYCALQQVSATYSERPMYVRSLMTAVLKKREIERRDSHDSRVCGGRPLPYRNEIIFPTDDCGVNPSSWKMSQAIQKISSPPHSLSISQTFSSHLPTEIGACGAGCLKCIWPELDVLLCLV